MTARSTLPAHPAQATICPAHLKILRTIGTPACLRRTHACTICPAHLKILKGQGRPCPARLRRTHTTTHARPERCPPCREIETQRYGLMERPCPMHSAPRVCLRCLRIRSFEIWPRALCPAHAPLSATPCPAACHPVPRWLPPHAPLATTPMPRCLPPHDPLPTTPCPAVYHSIRRLPPLAPLSTTP